MPPEYHNSPAWWNSTYDLSKVADRMVTGDFNEDGKLDVATFRDNGNCSARIDVWTSTGSAFSGYSTWWSIASGYCLSNVAARFVAGDFDGDGDDDVAAFHDYVNPAGKSRIHVWLSNGVNSFTWTPPPGHPGEPALGWWRIGSGYYLSQVGTGNPGDDRMVAGDFNGDNKDDIATFYNDVAAGESRIHVWISQSNYFEWDPQPNPTFGWYSASATSYPLDNVGGRFVAGDFDADGDDDVAAFHNYGNGKARIHVWRSTTARFAYDPEPNGQLGWWRIEEGGYYLSHVGDRFVAGDFDGDGNVDVATLFGDTTARLDLWTSSGGGSGSSFTLHLAWWDSGSGYETSRAGGRIIAGDFDGQ